jgi:hypothetical protein
MEALSFYLGELPADKTNINVNFEQQDFAIIHKDVNRNLQNLQRALNNDKQVKFKVLQSYMSEYDIVDELRKTVSTDLSTSATDSIRILRGAVLAFKDRPIVDIAKTSTYKDIKDFIDIREPENFNPPLHPSFRSKGIIDNLYPFPNKPDTDPRRTGRIVRLDPPETINTNKDWFINNSLLYGFLMYGEESNLALVYVGFDKIKEIVTDQNLLNIIYAYTMPSVASGTQPTITAGKVKTFSTPSSAIAITLHNATLNDGQTRPNLVVVDGQPILDTTATAFLKMQAAAKADGVPLKLSSGFRPALGIGVQGTTADGKLIKMTTQEELRRDSKRWVANERAKYTSENEFVMKAPSAAFDPATAPPKASQHGNGIAVDVNTGGRNNFTPLNDTVYKWMIQNSWKFGFVRTVGSEEWHYEYYPTVAMKGPYAKIAGTNNNKFYTDLSLDRITIA